MAAVAGQLGRSSAALVDHQGVEVKRFALGLRPPCG
jgi:hypothetical protein